MTRSILVAGLVAAALAAPAGAAAAVPARAWPGAVIAYRDLTGAHGYHRAVAAAVAAWNRLHLGIRFVAGRPGDASVQIVYAAGRCLSGQAGSAPRGFRSSGARVVVRSCPPVVRPLLVAHELGRVLGLRDTGRTCSLTASRGASDGISFALPAGCSRWAPPAWIRSLVDPASATAARTMYTPPLQPGALGLQVGTAPRVGWRQPPHAGAARTVVARAAGRCPTAVDVAAGAATIVYDKPGYAGLHWVVDSSLPAVHAAYCYRAFNLNPFGRAAPSANTVTYVYDVPPLASFLVATAAPQAGAPTAFTDTSSDPDGAVVHWRWDFGDPASGAANVLDTADPAAGRAPAHTYAQPGSYTVTLTVVDDGGRSATVSQTVVVGGGR